MAVAVAGTPTVAGATGPVNAVTIAKPSGVADGDLLIAILRGSTSAASADFTLSGWTRIGGTFAANNSVSRLHGMYYKKIPSAAAESATSYTFTFTGTAGRVSGQIFRVTGSNPTTPIQVATTSVYDPVTVTNGASVASMTASATGLLIAVGGGEVVSPNVSTPTTPSGTTFIAISESTSGTGATRTVTAAYSKAVSAGATGAQSIAWSAAVSSPHAEGFVINPAASNVAPVAGFTSVKTDLSVAFTNTSTDSDGTIASYDWDYGDGTTHGTTASPTHVYAAAGTYTVTLTVTDNGGLTNAISKVVGASYPNLARVGSTAPILRLGTSLVQALYQGTTLLGRFGYTVTDMLADSAFQVAHRGLGDSYPEESMAGYDAAVAAGFKALEVSLQRTSDGVFVCSHDDTTARVFTTNYTIASTSWATLSALNSATGPMMRLETLLDKYGSTHVIFIDDKTNLLANTNALLTLLATYPNPQSHFVYKGYKGWYDKANIWLAAGYQTWGIYYTGEPQAAPDRMSSFTILGMQWDATGTDWTTLTATGKRVMGHVIYTDAQRIAAAGQGATGFMTSNLIALP